MGGVRVTDTASVSASADDLDTYFQEQLELLRVNDAFTALSQPVVTAEFFRRYFEACAELDPFRIVDRA